MKEGDLMKKKLFLALLTALLLLLAATTALAVSPSDYNCPSCGEPCTGWFQHHDDTTSVHAPYCSSCGVMVGTATFPCTPAEGTATCMDAALCSVCGSPDWLGSAPDPNAHDWGGWEGFSASTHIRVCLDCGAEEEAPHTGGDGACWTTCGECGWNYSNPDGEHRSLANWVPYSMTQHYRECQDCVGAKYTEYGEHTGGTAACNSLARCETCDGPYGELDFNHHVNLTDWEPYSTEQHYRKCADFYSSDSYEYEAHRGGDGSCMPLCEVCGRQYYNENGTHNTLSAWRMENNELHSRQCEDCYRYSEQGATTAATAPAAPPVRTAASWSPT